MFCRSFLICALLNVLFVKTHVIKHRFGNDSKEGYTRGLTHTHKWHQYFNNRFNVTLRPTRLRREILKVETAIGPTTTTTTTTTSTTFRPTTTRQRLTIPPEHKGMDPREFSRPVTNRNPFLTIQDPRPDVINTKLYTGPTFIEHEYYKYNVKLKGFHFALTMVILADQYAEQQVFLVHSPGSSYFYNNIYRVMLRYASSIREWISGKGSYTDTHKLWRKKLDYANEFVPTWLRRFIPWVPKSEWTKEEENYNKFQEEVEMKQIFIHNPYYLGKGTYWEESKK